MDLVCSCLPTMKNKNTKHETKEKSKDASVGVPSRRVANRASVDQYEATLCNMLNGQPIIHQRSTGGRKQRKTPVQILEYLYLGTYDDADNFRILRHLGITHVINCAALVPCETVSASLSRCGIFKYLPFYAEDVDDYDITQHFDVAANFIEEAKKLNGKVLVHCMKGVNRSVAVITAYLVITLRINLFEAVDAIHKRRSKILTNPGFRKQLIIYADSIGLLPGLEEACRFCCADKRRSYQDDAQPRTTSPMI